MERTPIGYFVISKDFKDYHSDLFASDWKPNHKFTGSLLPHQRAVVSTIIHRMEYLGEANRVEDEMIKLINGNKIISYTQDEHIPIKYRSNRIYIADSFGSGKTCIVARTICLDVVPCSIQIGIHNGAYIVKRPHRHISCSVVVCTNATLLQWQHELARFTTCRIFMCRDIRDLRKLIKLLVELEFPYDVIIMKCAASNNIVFDYQECAEPSLSTSTSQSLSNLLNKQGTKYIPNKYIDVLNGLAAHCKNNVSILRYMSHMFDFTFSYLFLDDFDQLPFPSTMNGMPHAYYQFIISGSMRRKVLPKTIAGMKHIDPSRIDSSRIDSQHIDIITPFYTPHHILAEIPTISDTCGRHLYIKCTDDVIKESAKCYTPILYKYCIDSINDDVMDMLTVIGADKTHSNSRDILSMLHADSHDIRVFSRSMGQLMNSILGKSRNKCVEAMCKIKIIDAFMQLPCVENVKQIDIEQYVDDLYHARVSDEDMRSVYNDVTHGQLLELRRTYVETRDVCMSELKRVRENIQMNVCPVCAVDLEYEDIYITRCCRGVVCADCASKTLFKDKGHIPHGICPTPKCRQPTSLNNVIYCPGEVNPMQMLEIDMLDPDNYEVEDIVVPTKPKMDYVFNILLGTPTDTTAIRIEGINVSGVIQGELISEPKNPRSFIIFGSYDDLLISLSGVAIKADMRHFIPSGNIYSRRKTIQEFKCWLDANPNNRGVLLLDMKTQISGINLQFVDAMIIYHMPEEKKNIGQLIGRVQRFGRSTSAVVYWIHYASESAALD